MEPLGLYTYKAELLDLYDPDTFTVRLSLGFDTYSVQNIRVNAIDVLEKYGVRGTCQGCGKRHTRAEKDIEKAGCAEAIEFTLKWLNDAESLRIKTQKKGKFGRWLSDTFAQHGEDWEDLGTELIKRGWARPYFGSTKECCKDWYVGFQ